MKGPTFRTGLRRPWFGHRRRGRVPVVLQAANNDCAAACLAMVLGAFGAAASLQECRSLCRVRRGGSTARDIVTAARQLGLRTRAFACAPAAAADLAIPMIAVVRPHHFVVIERFTRRAVYVVDPTVGRRQPTPQRFAADSLGIFLTFAPGKVAGRTRTRVPPPWWPYVRSSLTAARGYLIAILVATAVLQLVALAVPRSMAVVVDDLVRGSEVGVVSLLGFGMLGVAAAHLGSGWLRATLLSVVQRRVDGHLCRGLVHHLFALPLEFFTQRTSADLVDRAAGTAMIRELVIGHGMRALLEAAFLAIYFVVLAINDLMTASFTAVLTLVHLALFFAAGPRTRTLAHEHLLSQSKAQSALSEGLNGIHTVKATGVEQYVVAHWSILFDTALDAVQRRMRYAGVFEAAQSSLYLCGTLLLLWLGAWRVVSGTSTVGEMLGLNMLATMVLAPLTSLVMTAQRLQAALAHLARIADVLDVRPEPCPATPVRRHRISGRVELRGVGFRYHPEDPLVLADVSLTIAPGQKVAIVGPSGSGKSTLGKLLLGLYPASYGEVLFDEVPLAALDAANLRRQFGVVAQDASLFSASIRYNIALGDPDLSMEAVVEAARIAVVHDDVTALPMGYDTFLVSGASGLSGGQCQRLAIARAVARRPAVLLLDEATSHLDVHTERRVAQNLNGLTCTRIVIAHRLSTVIDADKVFVLDHGRLVEQGSPTELLSRGGPFASLVAQNDITDQP
ncbi:peptidase domain-containing ABC transporter [Micromonospora sp. AP08]|uniref:peptidase domain-containing ABC transporter n=1 Tax=Micromonospora sp. AP08 TaxID=2604467 RepID=UPI0011DA8EFE|nr:peptidase domain-containing ABC transporter [Micromonospora sp. AP08]TYB39765.1 peptidase domain-containing ABC transporter [Micromonospora sp. AP08]